MSDQTPNPMKTKEEVIEEAYKEGRRRGRKIQAGEIHPAAEAINSKAFADKKSQELPGPVQSPSDLIVEVDGEEVERLDDCCFERTNGGTLLSLGDHNSWDEDLKVEDHHIRLLTPEGGVVMDNKLNQKSEEG